MKDWSNMTEEHIYELTNMESAEYCLKPKKNGEILPQLPAKQSKPAANIKKLKFLMVLVVLTFLMSAITLVLVMVSISTINQKIDHAGKKLGQKTDHDVTKMNQKIDQAMNEMSQNMDQDMNNLTQKMEHAEDSLNRKMDHVVDEMSQEMDHAVNKLSQEMEYTVTNLSKTIDHAVNKVGQEIDNALNKTLNALDASTHTDDKGNSPFGRICPEGYEYVARAYCYMINMAYGTYQEQSNYCFNRGGYLAKIPNSVVNSAITTYMRRFTFSESLWGLYIGLVDSNGSNRDWRWRKPVQTLRYKNWGAGEPNTAWEKCAAIRSSDGKWIDVPCDQTLGALCEAERQVQ